MQNTEPSQGAQAPTDSAGQADVGLASQLAAAKEEIARLKDEMLRERAELDNQRKRMSRELEASRRYANERLLGDLLPVLDSLEAGLAAPGADVAKLREGMELTLRQLAKAAQDNGLGAIDPVGQPFNPELHQAMSLVESTEHAPGTVIQVYQKGYQLNGRLLRPALVLVAKERD